MICPHCHSDVEGQWVDVGIGVYEFWGATSRDTRMEFVCEQCEGALESEYTYQEYVEDMREEHRYDDER